MSDTLVDEWESKTQFREATVSEVRRAASLLTRQPQIASQFFVATTSLPVERIVGAASWFDSRGADAGCADGRFDWAVIPGWRNDRFPIMFLRQLARHTAAKGCRSLRAVRLVAPGSWEADSFRAAQFQLIARHEHFMLDVDVCRQRQNRIANCVERQRQLPPRRSVEPIDLTNSAAAAWLIQRHGLLAPDQFWSGLRKGRWQEFSAVLMHEERAEGVLLASESGPNGVSIYVLAASPDAGTPSGLVCYALFELLRKRCDALEINQIYFWAEPDKSPATRLIAKRFGGRVIGETVQFGLCL